MRCSMYYTEVHYYLCATLPYTTLLIGALCTALPYDMNSALILPSPIHGCIIITLSYNMHIALCTTLPYPTL